MAEISKIKLPSGNEYYFKDEGARSQIAAITGGDAVVFIGVSSTPITDGGTEVPTINDAPTAPSTGQLFFYGTEEFIWGADSKWHALGSLDSLGDLAYKDDVSLSPQTASVIGANATFTITQPTITLATNDSSSTGSIEIVASVSESNTNVKATASGANTAWNSKDSVNAITGYANPSITAFVTGVSSTSKKLATTSITGVNGSTSASLATVGTAATAATGSGTASTNNGDWLKNVSVSNETLILGAATLDTQSIPQYTFSNVSVPIAAAATTVATGKVADSDTNGATVVTAASASGTDNAITGLGTPTTKAAIGADSTFTITQPTIALATGATAGTGVVSLTNSVSHTSTNLKATATGANTAWNNKDSKTALTNGTTVVAQ